MRTRFFILFICLFPVTVFSQITDASNANDYFTKQQYDWALPIYKNLVDINPKDPIYNYRLGVCMLHCAVNKNLSIPYFKNAVLFGIRNPDIHFYLGWAYHLTENFYSAEKAYEKYLSRKEGDFLPQARRQFEMLQNAFQLYREPENVEIQNLGPNINSPEADYAAFLSEHNASLLFTSQRKDRYVCRTDTVCNADIYYSREENDNWQAAKNIGSSINTEFDEQLISITNQGQTFIFSHVNEDKTSAIAIGTYKKIDEVKKVEIPLPSINSKYQGNGFFINKEGTNIIFSSNQTGGFGGYDLYVVRRLPTGEWAKPQNLGSSINTPYDEDMPQLSIQENILFFASKGHNSIGGYDLFKSEWNGSNWGEAENFGYPINTTDDNMTISLSEDQCHGFISMWTPDGLGDLDIYKITFKDAEEPLSFVFCSVVDQKSVSVEKTKITVINKLTHKLVGEYLPNPRSGKYILPLSPATYSISIEFKNTVLLSEDIIILGGSSFKHSIDKTFTIVIGKHEY